MIVMIVIVFKILWVGRSVGRLGWLVGWLVGVCVCVKWILLEGLWFKSSQSALTD